MCLFIFNLVQETLCLTFSYAPFLVLCPTQPGFDVPADKIAEFKYELGLLETAFNDLVDKVADDLKVNKVDLAKVKKSISRPLLFDTHTDAQPCLDEYFNDILKADSIDSLFLLLTYKKIWTVLSPALLQRIVNQCGSSNIKIELECFMKELTELRKKTRLKEFAQVFSIPTDDGSILATKMGKEWEEKTLQDVEDLKRKDEKLSICTQIIGAKKSSIILLWRIPFPRSHNAHIRQIPHSFYEENDIKKVTLDGVTLFDLEVSMMRNDVCILYMYMLSIF